MTPTLLLYGATGYSGRLVARELAGADATGGPPCTLLLGGRDEAPLARMARDLGVGHRLFGLEDRPEALLALRDVDVVLNAAGPFADTAERLAKVALEAGCDYVDIGGEPDVYRRLNELLPQARARNCVLAPCVGFWAAASNLLLARALEHLRALGHRDDLGMVRIAMSRIDTCSRGSVETVWRSMRGSVVVARGMRDAGGKVEMRLAHEPVGRLERRFDYRDPGAGAADVRVASAVSLVDTLAAMHTLRARRRVARRVESYVEMTEAGRMMYQATSWMAPMAALPWLGKLVEQPIQALPAGPTAAERARSPHLVLLEIDDTFGDPLLRWRWKTPNIYQFTAQLAAAIALRVGEGGHVQPGWATASDVMEGVPLDFGGTVPAPEGPLRDSQLEAA